MCEHFPPPLLIALSVVSMEVFAPHKMAEIRLSARQRGGPESENTGKKGHKMGVGGGTIQVLLIQ